MKHAVFLIDLTQDVAACRHVADFARREGTFALLYIVTREFRRRDATGSWFREIRESARELGAELVEVASVAEAITCLSDKAGMLFSASESALEAHAFSHATFLAAPGTFVRVTLQHGLECIGFNHNSAHDRAWHHYVGMACDVAASWFEMEALHSVRPDQHAKIFAVGPPMGLDSPPPAYRPPRLARKPALHGLVCENLHSVRFTPEARTLFVDALSSFAKRLETLDGTVELRPHPGGLYLERNRVRLPPNVRFNRTPLYRQSLQKFAFCISSPSSVLFDLVWANVPVAVWAGAEADSLANGVYAGLHAISDEADWLEFAMAAAHDPRPFLEAQAKFLASLGIPADIPGRYRQLFQLVAD